jgi:hypothetical protein
MNQRRRLKSTPVRPTLQFSSHQAILAASQGRRILRRKVANRVVGHISDEIVVGLSQFAEKPGNLGFFVSVARLIRCQVLCSLARGIF